MPEVFFQPCTAVQVLMYPRLIAGGNGWTAGPGKYTRTSLFMGQERKEELMAGQQPVAALEAYVRETGASESER